ncbi:MAG: MFS transporter [Chlamydiales bacterium]|nr:MFS transporter [Chlamydiales bacterium]
MILLYILSGIFAAIAWANAMSLISLAATAEAQGKSLGIGQSMQSLGQFLAPLFGGIIAGIAIELIFYACSLLVFISFLLLLIYCLRRKNAH